MQKGVTVRLADLEAARCTKAFAKMRLILDEAYEEERLLRKLAKKKAKAK